MQIAFNKIFEAKLHPGNLISLLMKEFLRREGLASDGRLKCWLNAVEKVHVKDLGTWADLTSQVILNVATKDFCATLERGLSESERHFLAANVREFVEVYGKNRLEVLEFKA
jgi:hypothetical protein